MKSQKTLRKQLFDPKSILAGGMLIVLALFVTTQAAAAPAATSAKSKTAGRVTATALDPIALRPVWIFGNTAVRPSAARTMTTTVGQRLGVFRTQGNAPLVRVPARPLPRSPFTPRWPGR